MNAIKSFRLFRGEVDLLQPEDSKTLGLEPADDFAEVPFADRVRLDDRKCAIRHACSLSFCCELGGGLYLSEVAAFDARATRGTNFKRCTLPEHRQECLCHTNSRAHQHPF